MLADFRMVEHRIRMMIDDGDDDDDVGDDDENMVSYFLVHSLQTIQTPTVSVHVVYRVDF